MRQITTSPEWAWLQPLYRLIADVDHALDYAHDLPASESAAIGAHARELLSGFETLEMDTWRDGRFYRQLNATQRDRLDRQVGELLYLLAAPRERPAGANPLSAEGRASFDEELALNARALSCFPKDQIPAALWKQRARLLELSGQTTAAAQLLASVDRSVAPGVIALGPSGDKRTKIGAANLILCPY